jgi:hypothetical protein
MTSPEKAPLPRIGRHIASALGLLLLLLVLSASLAQAQDGAGRTVTIEAYWQQVEKALGTVASLKEAGGEAVRPALDSLAADFEAISGLELAGGQQMPLDSGYLVARLRDPGADLDGLEGILASILNTRENWPAPSHGSQDLSLLAQILAGSEFQSLKEEPGPLQRLWQSIKDFLSDIFNRIFPRLGAGPGSLLRLVLTAAGVIALIITLVFTVRGILSDIVAEEESQDADEDSLAVVSAEQALERARTYSRSGDYRSAVRYLYMSSLMLLEERGLVRYDRTQTNQEYLRGVASRPELANVLRDVIDVFDRVWYGFQALDQQSFSHYVRRVEQLRRQR